MASYFLVREKEIACFSQLLAEQSVISQVISVWRYIVLKYGFVKQASRASLSYSQPPHAPPFSPHQQAAAPHPCQQNGLGGRAVHQARQQNVGKHGVSALPMTNSTVAG